MQGSWRNKIIASVTFLAGLYFFLVFLLPEEVLKTVGVYQAQDRILLGFTCIGLVTFGLGLINLFWIHGAKIIYTRKGWGSSFALLFGLVLMLATSIADWYIDSNVQAKAFQYDMLGEFAKRIVADAKQSEKVIVDGVILTVGKRVQYFLSALNEEIKKSELLIAELDILRQKNNQVGLQELVHELTVLLAKTKSMSSNFATSEVEQIKNLEEAQKVMPLIYSAQKELLTVVSQETFPKKLYKLLFNGLFVSLGSAMFSLLGVYIAAAAYRAFRIKSFESALMMFTALLVMLGQISFGLWIYDGMPLIRDWLLKVPSSAAARAITIGASIAGLVLAIRMWFSIETDSFSKKKQQ
jgi:hypothetical protein